MEEPIYFSYKINLTALIENRKGFEEFIEEYNWEYYELILYIASCNMISEIFDKYNEYIMIYLYDGMNKLRDINFSSGLLSIGDSAFYECNSLKEIVLPKP